MVTLECIVEAYFVSKVKWAFKLAPHLSGKAQQAYAVNIQVIMRQSKLQSCVAMISMRKPIGRDFKRLNRKRRNLTENYPESEMESCMRET